jgi:putative sigma-54 modulation protein
MTITVTSRHFRAHQSLVEYAEEEIRKLSHFYDGIIKCDVILNYEKPRNSVKIAEVKISVYGTVLTSVGNSDDFEKSIDIAIDKVLTQLKKYKDRLHDKNRKLVRAVKAKA